MDTIINNICTGIGGILLAGVTIVTLLFSYIVFQTIGNDLRQKFGGEDHYLNTNFVDFLCGFIPVATVLICLYWLGALITKYL
jgi:hypothetical protein